MQGRAGMLGTICYADIKIRKFVALVMLHDGCQIFSQTSLIQKFDKASTVAQSRAFSSYQSSPANGSTDRIFFADVLWISLCFEVFFKATLLLRGYLVHKIDAVLDETLALQQLQQPIKISELSSDIFNNLSAKTISWDLLLAYEYKNTLQMPSKLFDILEKIVDLRSHIQSSLPHQKTYSQLTRDDLLYICMYYREIVGGVYKDLLAQHEDFQTASMGHQSALLRQFYTTLMGKPR